MRPWWQELDPEEPDMTGQETDFEFNEGNETDNDYGDTD